MGGKVDLLLPIGRAFLRDHDIRPGAVARRAPLGVDGPAQTVATPRAHLLRSGRSSYPDRRGQRRHVSPSVGTTAARQPTACCRETELQGAYGGRVGIEEGVDSETLHPG